MISTPVAPLLREFIIETCGMEGKALRYNYQLLDCALLTYLLSLDGGRCILYGVDVWQRLCRSAKPCRLLYTRTMPQCQHPAQSALLRTNDRKPT